MLKRRTGRSCIVQSCRGEATADRDFLATHAGTHVYPTKHHYCQQTWPKLQRWLQHYNINTITCRLAQLDEQQWPQHLRQSKQWIAHSDVQYLRKIEFTVATMLPQPFLCIVHFCTGQFSRKHLGDPAVYAQLALTPPQATQYLQQLTHHHG